MIPYVEEPIGRATDAVDRGPVVGVRRYFGHGDVEMLTLTGDAALKQCREDRRQREEPGVEIGVHVHFLFGRASP